MNIHAKTALSYITRTPFQALAAIFVLTLTFFVGTLFAVIFYSSGQVLSYFETRPQIIGFIKDTAKSEDISALQSKLTADPRIKDVRFVTKEQALSIYKKATNDNPLLGELVSPSIFPASIEFSVKDLSNAQSIISDVKNELIVDSVGFTAAVGGEKNLSDVVGRLRSITFYLRVGGAIFSGTLIGTSLLVLLIIISMRMAGRREEVEILNLIGATPGFIRSPIILEAVLYSLIGVILGWALAFILVLYTSIPIISYLNGIPVLPGSTLGIFELFGIFLGIELALGLLLAFGGSSLAVARVRRNR